MVKQKYIIGIDEAGRGPLAGPVSVGVVLVPIDFDWGVIPGVGDSKQVNEKKREKIFLRAKELQKAGQIDFAVELVSARLIDKDGIVPAISTAMAKALHALQIAPLTVDVKLDGGLRAPNEYLHQDTIIKGDAKEKVIGLASIMAKVTRDRYMKRIASKTEYLPYDFGKHKGYGTKAHREAVARHGLSREHRVSYCKNIELL